MVRAKLGVLDEEYTTTAAECKMFLVCIFSIFSTVLPTLV